MNKQEKKATRDCPFCGEEILATAKKCKHCGEFLDEELKKERQEESTEKENNKDLKLGDFTNCKELKFGHDGKPPVVRCPKCGYNGISKYKDGTYNGCLAFFLFICFIIPAIIYSLATKTGHYVCPMCGNEQLEDITESKEKKEKK